MTARPRYTDGLLVGLCLVSFGMTCAMLAGLPATWANVALVVGGALLAGQAVAWLARTRA